MTQPYDPNQPPPYGAPYGYGYGMPTGQRVNDPAPMGPRLLARIIDGVLVAVVIIVVVAAAGIHVLHRTVTPTGTTQSFSLVGASFFKVALIGALISALYEVTMLSTRGATLGKMAVGVGVRNIETGQIPSVSQAFTRWVIPAVAQIVPTGLVWILVVISPFFDSTHRNRGWYDYAARTIAVRTR